MRRLQPRRQLAERRPGGPAVWSRLAAAVVLGSLLSLPATAAVQIQPVELEADVAPGRTFQVEFQLTNTAARDTVGLTFNAVDVQPHTNGQLRYVSETDLRHGCARWLTVTPSEIDLRAGSTARITVKGQLPAGAAGSYHAAILIEPWRLANPPGAGTQVSVTYAMPVNLTAPGGRGAEVSIADLAPATARVAASEAAAPGPTELAGVLTLRNGGDRLARARGQVGLLRLPASGRVAQLSFGGPTGVRLLPEATGQVRLPLPADLPAGDYELTADVRVDGGPRLLARRRLTVAGQMLSPNGATVREALGSHLELAPRSLAIPLRVGETARRSVVVHNQQRTTVRCEVEVTGYEVGLDGSVNRLPGDVSPVAISPAQFELQPQARRRVELKVTAAADWDFSRERYWLVRVAAWSGGTAGGQRTVAEAVVRTFDPLQVTPAKLTVPRVEVAPGDVSTSLRLWLHNAGGRQTALTGMLVVMPDTGQRWTVPVGGAEDVLPAGSTRLLELTLPAPLLSRWSCQLTVRDAAGALAVAFEIAPPAGLGPEAGE